MAVNWVDRVPTRANRVLVTPEDGGTPYYATITRADEPSVVGTPVNAANLNAMQNAAGLMENKTVYVSTTGSDTSGDGSQAAPYATISRALSVIPRNLNGFIASIYVAPGTYNQELNIYRYGNGILQIIGTTGDSVTIPKLSIINVQFLEVKNILLNIVGGQMETANSTVVFQSPVSVSGGSYGVFANTASNIIFVGNLDVSNIALNAIVSTNCSSVYIQTLTGSGIDIAFVCTKGGICAYGSNQSTSRVVQYTENGGRIYTASQTNIAN